MKDVHRGKEKKVGNCEQRAAHDTDGRLRGAEGGELILLARVLEKEGGEGKKR